ncbi:hypothetical protein ACFL1B_04985, partial [Nanoarchaeota archaeon]
MDRRPALGMIFILLVVLTLVFVAAQIAQSPRPTILAVYPEPVMITDAYITDSVGTSYTVVVNPVSGYATDHRFTPDSLLRNADYTLFVAVEDRVANARSDTYDFSVDVAFGVTLIEPTFGVAASSPYTLTLETTVEAICSYLLIDSPTADVFSGSWNGQPLTTSPWGYTHTMNADFEGQIWFICRDRQNGEIKQMFDFSVDSTAPVIDVIANPALVQDPASRTSTLEITTDDPTVCWVDNVITSTDPALQSSYRDYHETTFTYNVVDTNRYDYTYNIRCVNLAGLESITTVDVGVEFTMAFSIDIIQPGQYAPNYVTIEAQTPVQANCEFREQGGTFQSMSASADLTSHIASPGYLDNNQYTYEVKCTSVISTETVSFSFTVDGEYPQGVAIITRPDTCSQGQLEATFNGTDNIGIDYFNYSIREGYSNFVVPLQSTTSTRVTHSLNLQVGETYTWSMTAYDLAGNGQTAYSISTVIRDQTHWSCDTTDPTVTLTEEDSIFGGGAKQVVVDCQDTGSGCAATYRYELVDTSASCGALTMQNYDTSPIQVIVSALVCVEVSDINGNTASASLLVQTTVSPTCLNTQLDSDETDVDCGGACPACIDGMACEGDADCQSFNCLNNVCAAPTCWDGKHNGDESDVDCGGSCYACINQGQCGDGIIDAGEDCDGTNLQGFGCADWGYSGTLSCDTYCDFDISGCGGGGPGGGSCPDGVRDAGEECDGSDFGGFVCADWGFTSGSLSCSNSCDFDTSMCGYANTGGDCGNGVMETGEECDGSDFGGFSCADWGFSSGSLSCNNCQVDNSACTNGGTGQGFCGDGTIDSGESCDGSNLGGFGCVDWGFSSGTLSCDASCQYDTGNCGGGSTGQGYCGDTVIDAGESCDGSNLGGFGCVDWGLTGSLSCDSSCDFDTADCSNGDSNQGFCGDGTVDAGETCDGSNLQGMTCYNYGFDGGTISCSSICDIDTTMCTGNVSTFPGWCGDGAVDAGESCDGSNLGGFSCQDWGFSSGTLSCDASCQYDTNTCSYTSGSVCNDGVMETGEECDGSDFGGFS